MGVVTSSPLLGALVGAALGLGVLLAVAGWLGLLDRPADVAAALARRTPTG